MNSNTDAMRIIAALNRHDPLAECQGCRRPFHLSRAGLFYVTDIPDKAREQLLHCEAELESERAELKKRSKNISARSQTGAKAVNLGFILEKLTPSFESFPFNARDCRAIGDPIDFIIFENLSEQGRVDRITFGDIKTGAARLSDRQKSIRDIIERKRLVWSIYED